MQIRIHSLELNHNLFRYTEGRIEQKSRPPRPRLSFSARSLSELADVTIECEEGDEILAHKCILAARYLFRISSTNHVDSGSVPILLLFIVIYSTVYRLLFLCFLNYFCNGIYHSRIYEEERGREVKTLFS